MISSFYLFCINSYSCSICSAFRFLSAFSSYTTCIWKTPFTQLSDIEIVTVKARGHPKPLSRCPKPTKTQTTYHAQIKRGFILLWIITTYNLRSHIKVDGRPRKYETHLHVKKKKKHYVFLLQIISFPSWGKKIDTN